MEHVYVLGIILAGGRGQRLYPLTKQRSKPAVPFGGKYRIVDFVLSNFINSGIYSIYVLTQFKSQSLLQHLHDGWQFSDLLKNQFIIPVPAQMHKGEKWYEGTSDAIFQNIHLLELARPELVAVFGADHIYRMDISQMVAYHRRKGAEGTVAALPIPVSEASRFGVMEIDESWRIQRFYEKNDSSPEIPGRPGWCLASMGNYVFGGEVLIGELKRDATDTASEPDFGRDILPQMVRTHAIYAYDFETNLIAGETARNRGYWRDVGTIEAYYDANMDLRTIEPALNLYNHLWPLHTAEYHEGPTKYTFNEEGRQGGAIDSVICEGSILAGGRVIDSVLGRRVRVEDRAQVKESVVMDNCRIGAGARIRRAIIDKNAVIPDGERIGYDLEQDREKYFVSETGIVVVEGRRSPIPLSPITI